MISKAFVTHWSTGAPWPTRTQVEQDLLLSRLICEIANHPYLGEELVFTIKTKISENPKVYLMATSEEGDPIRSSSYRFR